MYKSILIVLLVSVLFSCKSDARKEFEVTGTIKNAATDMVYLEEYPLGADQRILIDSSKIDKDGNFKLSAKRSEESLFQLFVKGDEQPVAVLINDASKIRVAIDLNQKTDYVVEGSPSSKSLKDFSVSVNEKWTELYGLSQQMQNLQNAGASDSLLLATNNRGSVLLKAVQDQIKAHVRNSESPVNSAWPLVAYSQLITAEDYKLLMEELVKRFPSNKGVAAAKAKYDQQVALQNMQQQTELPEWVGKPAPELSLPDANGKQVSLNSLKGKYVLVDFWASWCGPCRRENPTVVAAYNKHKNKNFTILGVSLDRDKQEWLDAIQKDKLAWTHISDLGYWQSKAVSTFGFSSIPFNVLLDPQGVVVAQDLRGEALDAKLMEVLK